MRRRSSRRCRRLCGRLRRGRRRYRSSRTRSWRCLRGGRYGWRRTLCGRRLLSGTICGRRGSALRRLCRSRRRRDRTAGNGRRLPLRCGRRNLRSSLRRGRWGWPCRRLNCRRRHRRRCGRRCDPLLALLLRPGRCGPLLHCGRCWRCDAWRGRSSLWLHRRSSRNRRSNRPRRLRDRRRWRRCCRRCRRWRCGRAWRRSGRRLGGRRPRGRRTFFLFLLGLGLREDD